jgi:serine/threonine-protein kinase
MEYWTTEEVAEIWGVTVRRIQAMCDRGNIPTAVKLSRIWVIPKGTPKPPDGRTKAIRDAGVRKMVQIPNYDFTTIEPINKGWSSDKKYYIETVDGDRLLLRVADIAEYERKKAEFDMLKRVAELDIPASRPVDFGICNDGKSVYQLLTWIDGEDLENVLPTLSEAEQYVLGVKAGEILRKIHQIPAPDEFGEWSERYFSVIDERVDAYRAVGTPFEGSDVVLAYLETNRHLLKNRPQTFIHGDYHVGNLMVGHDGELYVIDLLDEGFGNYCDPWYDLKTFGENENMHFSTGFVRGYFCSEPPKEFWDTITYYIVNAALTSIVWRKYNKPEELPEALRWNEANAAAIREGRSPLMKWYLRGFYIQYIDGVPFKLKSPFDFSLLAKYGKVFKVFDDQDSGNICFGVQADDGRRYFVKFAGAPTEQYTGTIESAIERLKAAVPVYEDLAHPTLIHFVTAEEVGGGFTVVFDWVDGICAHRMYPADHRKFKALPHKTKLNIFAEILVFHAFVSAQSYTAVDFYDGSIMWDYVNERTIICDIDFYSKESVYGSEFLWGCSRIASPEERVDGAVVDEISNVYNMGATAFCLFADSDRSREAWPLNQGLYEVVKKATSDDRSQRQQSIRQLIEEWEDSK